MCGGVNEKMKKDLLPATPTGACTVGFHLRKKPRLQAAWAFKSRQETMLYRARTKCTKRYNL
jgi:hypothetical protein